MMKEAWLKKQPARLPARQGRSGILVLFIFLLGLGLRLWGSWLPFMEDGTDIIPIARDISLWPSHFNFPLQGSHHGPFLVYQVQLSSLIFGQNLFGYALVV